MQTTSALELNEIFSHLELTKRLGEMKKTPKDIFDLAESQCLSLIDELAWQGASPGAFSGASSKTQCCDCGEFGHMEPNCLALGPVVVAMIAVAAEEVKEEYKVKIIGNNEAIEMHPGEM